MNFDNDKKVCLSKIDKSKKGSIDEAILDLVDVINSSSDYYTTSSCSGRIVLQREAERKNENEWLFVSHDLVDGSMLFNQLEVEGDVWFKMQAAILHIACRTLEDAQNLVDFARNSGFRRSGIQSTNKKYLVEIVGVERVETLVVKDGDVLVSNDSFKTLIEEANSRLTTNWNKLEKLKEFFK